MSKRAEKFAEKIHNTALLEAKKYATEHGGSFVEEVCYGRGFKTGAIVGYEQAEKDLALTVEDIVRLDLLIMNMVGEGYNDGYKTRPFYEEVLRRFNDRYRKK